MATELLFLEATDPDFERFITAVEQAFADERGLFLARSGFIHREIQIIWTAEELADPEQQRLARFVSELGFPMVLAFDEADDEVIGTWAAGYGHDSKMQELAIRRVRLLAERMPQAREWWEDRAGATLHVLQRPHARFIRDLGTDRAEVVLDISSARMDEFGRAMEEERLLVSLTRSELQWFIDYLKRLAERADELPRGEEQ